MVDFKLPAQYQWTCNWEEMHTVDFNKLEQGNSSLPLCRGLLIIFSYNFDTLDPEDILFL